MQSDAGSDLKVRFDTAFADPAGVRRLKSKRGRSLRIDLETWYSQLAGPLDSIIKTGGCSYVYDRDDVYFSGIEEPLKLRDRLRDWHTSLLDEINDFVPESSDEIADLNSLRRSAADVWTVVEEAWEIERQRWTVEAG